MNAGTPAAAAPARAVRPRLEPKQLWALAALAVALYVALAALDRAVGGVLPDSLKVGLPFLFAPLALLWRLRQPFEFGAVDRSFFLSAAAYAPYAVWAAVAAGNAAWYYRPIAASVTAFPLVLWWAADTFFHVGAVDFFTKRLIQREAQARVGARNALWIQWAAWSAGHVLEWTWLRLILGDAAAAFFLGSAGLLTGLAYMRWRNVLGLMVGHFLVNAAAAGAAVALYG